MSNIVILGVDPGAKHCGTVLFKDGIMEWSQELLPYELYARIQGISNSIDYCVMEEFRLYPWLMGEQGFSALETVEVIGVVKYICITKGIPVTMQPASIKKPTMARLRGEMKSKNPHCRDAEMHVRFYLEQQRIKARKQAQKDA